MRMNGLEVDYHNLGKCELCSSEDSQIFSSIEKKLDHLLDAHKIDKVSYCCFCKKITGNYKCNIYKHFKTHHSNHEYAKTEYSLIINNIKNRKKRLKINEKYKTYRTNKKINYQLSYKNKIFIHDISKKRHLNNLLVCPKCRMEFSDLPNFKKHIDRCVYNKHLEKKTTGGNKNNSKLPDPKPSTHTDLSPSPDPNISSSSVPHDLVSPSPSHDPVSPPSSPDPNISSSSPPHDPVNPSPSHDPVSPPSSTFDSIDHHIPDGFKFHKKTQMHGLKFSYFIENEDKIIPDPETSFNKVRDNLVEILKSNLDKYNTMKTNYEMRILFRKEIPNSNENDPKPIVYDKVQYFNTQMVTLTLVQDIDQVLNSFLAELCERFDLMLTDGSGFTSVDILSQTLNIFLANPLRAAGQNTDIDPSTDDDSGFIHHLPKKLINRKYQCIKKILISPPNYDNLCLYWNIAIFNKYSKEHKDKVYYYLGIDNQANQFSSYDKLKLCCGDEFENIFKNLSNVQKAPFALTRANFNNIFKKLNLKDYSFNVLGYNEKNDSFYPIYFTNGDKNLHLLENYQKGKTNDEILAQYHASEINLLYLPPKNKMPHGHFCLITNFNLLLKKINKSNRSKLICKRCFCNFTMPRTYANHVRDCQKYDDLTSHCSIPTFIHSKYDPVSKKYQAPLIQTKSIRGMERKMFFSSLDIETYFQENANDLQKTQMVADAAFCFTTNIRNASNNDLPEVKKLKESPFPSYGVQYGPDCIKNLLMNVFEHSREALKRERKIRKLYKNYHVDSEILKTLQKITKCQVCGVTFDKSDPKRQACIDHDHLEMSSNGYRLLICNLCNGLKRKESLDTFTCTSHNGSKFDINYVLVEICKSFENHSPLVASIDVVSATDDRVISASVRPYCDICHFYNKATGLVKKKDKQDIVHPNRKKSSKNSRKRDFSPLPTNLNQSCKKQMTSLCNDDKPEDNEENDSDSDDYDYDNDYDDDDDYDDDNADDKKQTTCKHFPLVIFSDSLKILPGSLSSLIKELKNDCVTESDYIDKFPVTYHYLKNKGYTDFLSIEQLTNKNFFPYKSYKNEDFKNEKDMISKETWNDENEQPISDSEYMEVQKIYTCLSRWAIEKNKPVCMKNYLELYLLIDTLSLLDIAKFKSDQYFKYYNLELLSFPSLPSYALACFYKMLNCPLEAISDANLYIFLKDGLVGGFCGLTCKYFESSNQFIKNNIQPDSSTTSCESSSNAITTSTTDATPHLPVGNEDLEGSSETGEWERTFIEFKDKNVLYAGVLCDYNFPQSEFEFLEGNKFHQFCDNFYAGSWKNWTKECVYSVNRKTDEGVIKEVLFGVMVECTLKLDEKFHTKIIDDFPPLVSKRLIKLTDLSKNQNEMARALNKKDDTVSKVVGSLNIQKRVKLDFRYLKLLLDLNYEVIEIHRVLQFVIAPYLRDFVQLTANLRTAATSTAASQAFKTLNNSLYGRFLLAKEKHRKAKLCFSKQDSIKCIDKPTFTHSVEITNNTSFAVLKPKSFRADDATYIGVVTLQLAKVEMCRFYHIELAPIFTRPYCSIRYLYGDTDSIAYAVTLKKNLENIDSHYEILREIVHLLDTSNLSESHPFFTYKSTEKQKQELLTWRRKNSKLKGKWKFEAGNSYIWKFLGLKSKIYSILMSNGLSIEKMKGCVRQVLQTIDFKDYLFCQMSGKKYKMIYNQTSIRSRHHRMFYEFKNKEVANNFDNKRWYLPNNRDSYAIGSKWIKDFKEIENLMDGMLDIICES